MKILPFGALDKPAPGGTASGSNYRVNGRALTPPPQKIPSNGVHLFIDGVDLGAATCGIFRQDVYDLFPGYENRSGALVYYDFNTTGYDNGMHTIEFAAADKELKIGLSLKIKVGLKVDEVYKGNRHDTDEDIHGNTYFEEISEFITPGAVNHQVGLVPDGSSKAS
jgi:hypothetical protein